MVKKLKTSLRAFNTPLSPIRKFVPLLQLAKKKGLNVFELHIGQPDLKTPSQILSKIRNFNEKIIRYTPSNGIPEVQSAWKKYFKGFGINFNESEIVVTIGGSEAIFFALSAICDPEEEVIVFEPFYTNYNGIGSIVNVKLVPVRTFVKTGFHLPDKKSIEKKISKKTKAILICNPSNPTGTVYSKKELQMIVDIANKHNLFILADEVYREFVYDGQKHFSIMDFKAAHNKAVILDSISKRFSACGARIGCLASKNKDIIAGVTKFAQARLSLPMVEQIAAVPLLLNSKAYTRKIVKEYKKRRDAVYEGLQEIPGIQCLKPKGAFYITVKLPVKSAEDFTRWLLTKFSYNNQTVMLAPAAGFYASKGLGKDEVRIAFVLSAPKMKQAMKVLRIALEKYKS
ncbi:MAG: pyridoxal phosphate-dependent aminotransferase [Patescibacteria group bacterium]|nr:pyridoxal phosphate-dependent aminotransferase [Patescibacteria group bacterium]